MTLDRAHAQSFAEEWISAWNAHDLERILSHYADCAEFHSPGIARYTDDRSDFVKGKSDLRAYWGAALPQVPNLKFTLIEVFLGSDALTIHYANDRGQRVAETCIFGEDGLVTLSIANYL